MRKSYRGADDDRRIGNREANGEPGTPCRSGPPGGVDLHQSEPSSQDAETLGPSPRPTERRRTDDLCNGRWDCGAAALPGAVHRRRGTHDKLRRVQDLLRREIPDGDPGEIFDRALSLLPRTWPGRRRPCRRSRGRPGGDDPFASVAPHPGAREARGVAARRRAMRLRCLRRSAVQREGLPRVPSLRALRIGGEATVMNIALRCRRHNARGGTGLRARAPRLGG